MRPVLRFSAALLWCISPLSCAGQAAANGTAIPVQPVPPSPQNGAVLSQPADGDQSTAGSGDSRIRIDVRVTERSGKLVTGLGPADFTVLDNGQPAKILSFRAYSTSDQPPDPPVQVLVIFDTVNTDFNTVSYTRLQVTNFLRQNGGHLTEPVTIAWLTNDGIESQSEPSLDGNALAAQIEAAKGRLRTETRAAGFWGDMDRFQFSLQKLGEIVSGLDSTPGRKLLIWAGPGWPAPVGPEITISAQDSAKLFSEIVRLSAILREGRVTVYSISGGTPGPGTFLYESYLKGVKKASQTQMQDLSLKVLAVQSGGLALAPSNDVAGLLDTCVKDADAFYSLSFDPSSTDSPGQYHKIEVRIDKPGLAARTRTGYYGQLAAR